MSHCILSQCLGDFKGKFIRLLSVCLFNQGVLAFVIKAYIFRDHGPNGKVGAASQLQQNPFMNKGFFIFPCSVANGHRPKPVILLLLADRKYIAVSLFCIRNVTIYQDHMCVFQSLFNYSPCLECLRHAKNKQTVNMCIH